MSEDRFVTGIKFKYGCKSIIFHDAVDIKATKNVLTFRTLVKCLGNNTIDIHNDEGKVVGTRRVTTQLTSETASGIEHIISNPVQLSYKDISRNETIVTAYLDHTDSYEIIKE